MKKLLSILFFAFTCFIGANAQADMQSVYEIRHAFDFYLHNKAQTQMANSSLYAENIQGSPYLNDEFIKGTVFTTSKTQFVDVPLRYNIYSKQLEFLNADEQILAIAVPEIIEKVEFGDFHMEYIPYQNGKKISKGYFLVMEKGDASLYCRHNVVLEQAKSAAAYQSAQPPRFIRKSDLFYIRINKEAAKPVAKKRELQAIFSNKGKEISTFLKKNKIKPKNAESLKALVIYYNSL